MRIAAAYEQCLPSGGEQPQQDHISRTEGGKGRPSCRMMEHPAAPTDLPEVVSLVEDSAVEGTQEHLFVDGGHHGPGGGWRPRTQADDARNQCGGQHPVPD